MEVYPIQSYWVELSLVPIFDLRILGGILDLGSFFNNLGSGNVLTLLRKLCPDPSSNLPRWMGPLG